MGSRLTSGLSVKDLAKTIRETREMYEDLLDRLDRIIEVLEEINDKRGLDR